MKNKTNRSKVKFQQTTGSRSYIAHRGALVNSCYFLIFCAILLYLYWLVPNTEESPCGPKRTWIDWVQIFKDCHTSKMKGMSTPVQAVVVSPYSSCLWTACYFDVFSFNCLVCSQYQLLCSLLYTVILTYHFTYMV